jgi:hypothetical protein
MKESYPIFAEFLARFRRDRRRFSPPGLGFDSQRVLHNINAKNVVELYDWAMGMALTHVISNGTTSFFADCLLVLKIFPPKALL